MAELVGRRCEGGLNLVKSMVPIEHSAPFLEYECMYLTFTVQVSTCRLEMQARNWLRGDASTPLINAVGQ